ncbi:MAG TPA: amino acid permease [Woeseiaceae bacterium]|nr:amino acid permease [Woeseiaceae bacterium]
MTTIPEIKVHGSYRRSTVTAVVIANMIGTGVFTSLGFQLLEIRSPVVILALWLLGGVIALCGAMTYAELGAALPRSGGEYNFLSAIYHPVAGFVSGWVSATIGFAAPVALAAMTFSAYATSSYGAGGNSWLNKGLAVALVALLSAVHSISRRQSGGLQATFTLLKVAVIVCFCGAALLLADPQQDLRLLPENSDLGLLASGAFAVSLIYVSYAYSGWNAATYLSSELENPQRDLPRILFTGTAVVTCLYVALNFVFLKVAPMNALEGQVEVGYIAAHAAFGPAGGRFTGLALALLLVSTVSAMTLAGPRVLQVIGEDFALLKLLARTNADDLPYVAIILQSTLAVAFILTSSFESILVFAGFTLALNSFVTVLGVFVLRFRQPDLARPYRTFGYPITPLIFLLVMGWTLAFVLFSKPVEALFGLLIIASGALFYWLATRAASTTPA